MTLSDDDLLELVRLAKKATPGPWECCGRPKSDQNFILKTPAGHEYNMGDAIYHDGENPKFIAAANPTTVKAMAEELLARREVQKHLSAVCSTQEMLGKLQVMTEEFYKKNESKE